MDATDLSCWSGYMLKILSEDKLYYCKDKREIIEIIQGLPLKEVKLYLNKTRLIEIDIFEEMVKDVKFYLSNTNDNYSIYIFLLKHFLKNENQFDIKQTSIFNYLLTYKIFNSQIINIFKNLDKDSLKTFELLKNIINDEDYDILQNILKSDEQEQIINKLYQLFISFALLKKDNLIDKRSLLKQFEFNGVFFKKNYGYFEEEQLSVFQSVRCKNVKSPISIVKKECFISFKSNDIDEILLDNLFTEIYRDNIKTPFLDVNNNKQEIVQYFYKTFNNCDDFTYFINEYNKGFLDISDKTFIPSNLNKYFIEEFGYINYNKSKLTRINEGSKLYGLYGTFGSILLKEYYRNYNIVNKIEIKNDIKSEIFLTIVQTYRLKNNKTLKLIINLFYNGK